METIHLICWKYDTTTAMFQRDWALAKGIVESGINVEMDFIMPNNCKCENEQRGIHCNYWGDSNAKKGKIIAYLLSICKAISAVRKSSTILSSTNVTMMILLILFSKRGNLYLENNEYPPFTSHTEKFTGKIRLRLYNWVCKRCAGIFVISNKLREYFISIGVNPQKVHVINMTVDDNRFVNVEKQEIESYICYCGTVSNGKDGVDILLESFGMIAKEISNIKLYILGSRPFVADNEKNDAIIEKYGIRDRVYMPGPIPGSEMPQYLKNAQAVVLSRPDNIQAAYGFPTKLGEYLMTGNPVVVTRVGELDDFLEHKKSCLFAEPGNAADFAEKMKWVLQHLNESKIIGIEGKRVAEENFNYKIEGEKIANIIRKDCSAKYKLKKL
jgi:glycosyltransferase involved in cell wall biosynthesis